MLKPHGSRTVKIQLYFLNFSCDVIEQVTCRRGGEGDGVEMW